MIRLLLAFVALSLSGFAQITADTLLDRIARRIKIRGDNRFDILLLSGGGEYGAYGVGFLRGWKSRTVDPMPEFDMVTGISTGALIAPYAFAGDAKSLFEISAEYTERASDIKPSFELLFFLKRDGGLLNRTRLENTIRRNYNEELVSRLESGFKQSRILLMGTTNLRTGMGTIWNVEDELKQGRSDLPLFQKILLASTAVPGAFAPVKLKGDLHIDGGVASNTLLGLDHADLRQLAQLLQRKPGQEPIRIHLWVIVNRPVYPSVEAGNYRNVMAVRDRAERLLFGLKEIMTLTRYWEIAQAVNSTALGIEMAVHYTAVPQDMAIKVALKKIVDPSLMKKLHQYGYERARGELRWDDLPLSPYQRP